MLKQISQRDLPSLLVAWPNGGGDQSKAGARLHGRSARACFAGTFLSFTAGSIVAAPCCVQPPYCPYCPGRKQTLPSTASSTRSRLPAAPQEPQLPSAAGGRGHRLQDDDVCSFRGRVYVRGRLQGGGGGGQRCLPYPLTGTGAIAALLSSGGDTSRSICKGRVGAEQQKSPTSSPKQPLVRGETRACEGGGAGAKRCAGAGAGAAATCWTTGTGAGAAATCCGCGCGSTTGATGGCEMAAACAQGSSEKTRPS